MLVRTRSLVDAGVIFPCFPSSSIVDLANTALFAWSAATPRPGGYVRAWSAYPPLLPVKADIPARQCQKPDT